MINLKNNRQYKQVDSIGGIRRTNKRVRLNRKNEDALRYIQYMANLEQVKKEAKKSLKRQKRREARANKRIR